MNETKPARLHTLTPDEAGKPYLIEGAWLDVRGRDAVVLVKIGGEWMESIRTPIANLVNQAIDSAVALRDAKAKHAEAGDRDNHCMDSLPGALAALEIERLRGLLTTAHRKLSYLFRDYPGDKETSTLLAAIEATLLGKGA